MAGKFELQDVLPFLFRVTAEAGDVLLSYFNKDFRIDRKDTREEGIDIVTDADRASEEIILSAIGKEFPDHDILTEETTTKIRGSSWLWVVDPLDGTVNFAHGYPMFSISIALMENGRIVAGIVHDPLKKETFYAIRNGGAFLTGDSIRVSGAKRLRESILSTGFPYDKAYHPDNNLAEFSRVLPHVQGLRRCGSAALDLAYVSCGRLDGFWEFKLKPWDMAAGMLLVEEAGGRVSDRDGKPTDVHTYCVVASNGIIHDLLLGLLAGDGKPVTK
jgi:myo-inositol-1(or 4)-monophosphatase